MLQSVLLTYKEASTQTELNHSKLPPLFSRYHFLKIPSERQEIIQIFKLLQKQLNDILKELKKIFPYFLSLQSC